jgi:hypothetical protein
MFASILPANSRLQPPQNWRLYYKAKKPNKKPPLCGGFLVKKQNIVL